MPRKYVVTRRRTTRRRVRGAGILSWLRKAFNFTKKHKFISRAANSLGDAGIPFANTIGSVAGVLGLGLRKGGSLGPSGSGRRVIRRRSYATRRRR